VAPIKELATLVVPATAPQRAQKDLRATGVNLALAE
jgi:hypothetical protein